MNVNLTAIIKSHPGKEDALKEVLLELVKGSTTEEACLKYDLHQAADEPNVFIFHEIWRSPAELDAHGQTPHIAKFVKDSEALLLEPVKVYITNKLT
ncbi:antibiotic biosynthesis monooxygenase [Flavobacterium zepuense]|uniref:Antibiotic biosynthesis monooxygenase n=1 Tax=Flavobacterium zepuense TaxID=2593302 RepID=A0A552V0C5_9FLAO|nr:putative quinol monooxygenase [Flavobacterium zepuense]TRW23919.1 antibiotic biosynthesis monooxygenase [Flavobacterium zepuense]